MKRFTQLYIELDRTTRTNEKIAAMQRYFDDAPPRDAAWAVAFLAGQGIRRPVTGSQLRRFAAEAAHLPRWLVGECHDAVGDLGEAIALLVPEPAQPRSLPLHELVEDHTLPLRALPEDDRGAAVQAMWRRLDADERLVWHKIMLGSLRVGVARSNVVRALAVAADVDVATMNLRMTGPYAPTVEHYERLMSGHDDGELAAQPYPFYLASPWDDPPEGLGDRGEFQAEWKYDGIRSQLLHRGGHALVWSRGEEIINGAFPELELLARALPDGTVLDGEVLAWEDSAPLPFAALQRRLNRKAVQPMLFADVPVVFMAFDVLERDGRDVRDQPLSERRALLEAIVARLGDAEHLRIAPIVSGDAWDDLAQQHQTARQRGVEGLMLKRRTSPYRAGRTRGDWWKWKVDPHEVDAVLLYAQRGHGRRANLYTDFTFGVWNDGELVPVTKAYSGLTDEEFREVDHFIREHTLGRHGPVRIVEPQLVFTIAFQGVQASARHKSGLALRFPRMAAWRRDKRADEADTLDHLRRIQRRGTGGLQTPRATESREG